MNYKRILFKLSGEVLMGPDEYGINQTTIKAVAEEIKEVISLGIELCVVIGGGNIFRGMSAAADGMTRTTADHIGMLATVMNALALQNALENVGVPSRVLSALQINSVCEPYIRLRAIRHLEKGRVVIFGAGTGNPYFTTDTAAALRASEMSCDALFKGTKVDGVYDSDPKLNPNAERFDNITYLDVLSKDLQVMDAAAISVSRENNVPVVVFSLEEKGNFLAAVKGEGKFTIVKD